ncbi:MAG TPA: sigma-70 family RNA polymerase sigma factor, partial [Myxococcota bacterium]|nr:sigma-70 family RNA polymerase sigma factor [Myxococcota bacterium]
SVGAFLMAMTRSRAVDRLRRRCRAARLLKAWHDATPRAPAPVTPFENVASRRTIERVRAQLARLPDAQRRVLELAYFDGLSQREIASDLDAPLGTVKSLSRRALSKLGRGLCE